MTTTTLRASRVGTLRDHIPLLRLQSDESLVELTRQGNERAFEVLLDRYRPRLLSFCRHMLRSNEDAEDVLQEVFTAAYNALLADDREINVRPWLYRIARNRSLNHLRKVQPQASDTLDEHISDFGKSTADRVHQREEFRQLIEDVQTLPESQRTALLLREMEALSYEQVAEAMETTVGAVKSLLVRARVSLAELAQARTLNCDDVMHELGEVAEGLTRLSSPARKHINKCKRCNGFQKHLKHTNKALAGLAPIGPLLLLKELVFTKSASAAAGGAGLTAASGGGGAATGGVGAAISSLFQAGMGAVAAKTGAGLAAAALLTAGGVAVQSNHHPQKTATSQTVVAAPKRSTSTPVPTVSTSQPLSVGSKIDTSTPSPSKSAESDVSSLLPAASIETPASVVTAVISPGSSNIPVVSNMGPAANSIVQLLTSDRIQADGLHGTMQNGESQIEPHLIQTVKGISQPVPSVLETPDSEAQNQVMSAGDSPIVQIFHVIPDTSLPAQTRLQKVMVAVGHTDKTNTSAKANVAPTHGQGHSGSANAESVVSGGTQAGSVTNPVPQEVASGPQKSSSSGDNNSSRDNSDRATKDKEERSQLAPNGFANRDSLQTPKSPESPAPKSGENSKAETPVTEQHSSTGQDRAPSALKLVN